MADRSRVVVDLNVDLETDQVEKTKHLVELELGGELIWMNHSIHCPHFEIIFEGASPVKQTHKFTGTLDQPVSIRMPDERAEFFYKVHYMKKDGTRCRDDSHRSIRICPGGQHC